MNVARRSGFRFSYSKPPKKCWIICRVYYQKSGNSEIVGSKVKTKILALVVAVLMIVASVSAFADGETPGSINRTQIGTPDGALTVAGLKAGDVVNFYKVIQWNANTGWGWTTDFASIENVGKGMVSGSPNSVINATADEKTAGIAGDVLTYVIGKPAEYSVNASTGVSSKTRDAIPGRINSELAAELAKLKPNSAKYTATVAEGATQVSITENLEPGLYLAMINPHTPGMIYNPVFVSADYATDAKELCINN